MVARSQRISRKFDAPKRREIDFGRVRNPITPCPHDASTCRNACMSPSQAAQVGLFMHAQGVPVNPPLALCIML